jgi:signal transduction histidine kinase
MLTSTDELTRLREALAASEAEGARLRRELDETNRGVLALYAELDDHALALRHASDLKSSFLSNASHELRTPIVSVINLARLLLEDDGTPLASEQRRSLGYIQHAAQALNAMVDDLLDLAKIEAGKADVRVAPVRVADLFGTLRGMFRPLLRGDAVTLEIHDPPHDLELATDEARLAQILRNLVSNAIKFTERGSVRVTAAHDGDAVLFTVADSGVGIAPEHLERIFQEFEQIPGPLQQRAKGTGLGLPLSRRLAGLLGGSLSVASTVGHGSTFTVRLPVVGASNG